MTPRATWTPAWIALLCVTACLGCSTTISGRVVDAATGQPLAGVAVLGVWQRIAGLPGLHHHELVGVAEAQTDENGRFSLRRPRALADEESVTAYKFGYVAWNNIYAYPPLTRRSSERLPSTVSLEPFPPGLSHRDHLSFIFLATDDRGTDRGTPYFSNAIEQERRR